MQDEFGLGRSSKADADKKKKSKKENKAEERIKETFNLQGGTDKRSRMSLKERERISRYSSERKRSEIKYKMIECVL